MSDVIFSELECVGVKRFLRFLENDKTDLREIFFSGFRRKHLFIPALKNITGSLNNQGCSTVLTHFCLQK